MRQLPPARVLSEIENLRSRGDPEWIKLSQDTSGPLFGMHWHRVCLDEAHAINDMDSKSKPCGLALGGLGID